MRTLLFGVSVLILVGCGNTSETEKQTPEGRSSGTSLSEIASKIRTPVSKPVCERSGWNNECDRGHRHYTSGYHWNSFEPLTGLIGRRFRGIPTDGSSERAADIQQWEWALGGTAVLIRHALEDGSYGGDTYIYEDATSGELVYVYITNAGFRTEGVMRLINDSSFTAEEDVSGHESITKVRSTTVLNDDGSTSMTSEYLDNGEWVPGHAFTYVRTDQPLPRLTPKMPEAD